MALSFAPSSIGACVGFGRVTMRVLYPHLRKGTGADVYFGRAARAVSARSINVRTQGFPSFFEGFPPPMRLGLSDLGADTLIHTNIDYAYAFASVSAPLVSTLFHLDFSLVRGVYRSPLTIAWRRVLRRRIDQGLQASSVVVTMTHSARRMMEAEFGFTDGEVVYPGIEADVFRPLERRHRSKYTELLYVGKPSLRKGFDLLIEAFQQLSENYRLTIVSRKNPRKTISRHPRIRVLPHMTAEQLTRVYNDSDLLVMPSRIEGFGFVAAEAMACGRPVIGFQSPGLVEVVTDGRTGLLVDRYNGETLANAIEYIAEDKELARRMGDEGRHQVLSRFTFDRFGCELEACYRKAMM